LYLKRRDYATVVAVIGAVARTRLRETPGFADAKRRVKNAIIKAKQDPNLLNRNAIWNEKVNNKTALSLFL
jgi:MFS transporter, MHS family, proline/betaine transporter